MIVADLELYTVKGRVLIRHACVLIESARTAAHESCRGACRVGTWFFAVYHFSGAL
jgi:hypothetical protein